MPRPRDTANRYLPEGLYARAGKRATAYHTRINGKHIPLGNDRDEAEKKLADMRHGSPAVFTVAEMCRRFIANQRELIAMESVDALAESTVNDYEYSLLSRNSHILAVFGAMPTLDFLPTDAAQYLVKMRLENRGKRANKEIAALSSAFRYGLGIGCVSAHPILGVAYNKSKLRTEKPTIAEANDFFRIAAEMGIGYGMVATIAAVVAISGRRRSQVQRLMRSAAKDDGLHVTEGKLRANQNGRQEIVEWTPFFRSLIDRAMSLREVDSVYLFPTRTGGPYSDSGYKGMLSKIMAELVATGAKRFRTHDLQSFYVSEKMAEGQDPKTHRNPATTRRVYDRRAAIKISPLR